MPVGCYHHPDDIFDIGVWDLRLKEVTHAVNKDGSWAWPFKGFGELFWDKAKVESLLVRVASHAAETLCERFSVAVFAARTDLRTPPERVPRCICPLDL
jgi:hypothetical protein